MPEEKPAPGYAVLHIRFGPSGLPSYQTTAATAPFSRILSIPCPKKLNCKSQILVKKSNFLYATKYNSYH